MKGSLFAFMAGAFITLQGVANARISQGIGTWQAAAVTQLTGFITALIILLVIGDRNWLKVKEVKPLYWTGGAFAAVIIFGNVTAIHQVGVTLSIAVLLIAQLTLTFWMDGMGWFGVQKRKMKLPHFIGIGMMIIGVLILRL